MPEITLLENCVRDATSDIGAESLLRAIIRGAADRAPVDALVEMGRLLVRIRRDDFRREIESN
jgi:hypothetical protein